jgi:hypothetical protein
MVFGAKGAVIMFAYVETELDMPAEAAWQAVRRSDTLLYVNRGMLGFRWLTPRPETWRAGEDSLVRLFFFNFLPAWKHHLRIALVDPARRTIASEEFGGPVTTWDHQIAIEPIGATRCRYSDSIDIRAGMLTLPVACFAHAIYRYRQWRWRKLAKRVRGGDHIVATASAKARRSASLLK